jgi:hypothetical protein
MKIPLFRHYVFKMDSSVVWTSRNDQKTDGALPHAGVFSASLLVLSDIAPETQV